MKIPQISNLHLFWELIEAHEISLLSLIKRAEEGHVRISLEPVSGMFCKKNPELDRKVKEELKKHSVKVY